MAREGRPFAALTCYDYTTAQWLSRAGVHLLLVGDSAAQVVLGLSRTIDMPLGVLVALTAAVKRGAPLTPVMADMPFMSYQADDSLALRNAARFMTRGLADIVKIEADASFAPLVRKMTRAGIPVCAHVGCKPQHLAHTGAYRAAALTAAGASELIADAIALQDAGAAMLLVEAVPAEVAGALVEQTSVPVIGIGAGPACHGQILVLQDLLGLTEHPPRFAEPVASLGPALADAARQWVDRVSHKSIGGRGYRMKEGEAQRLAVRTTDDPSGPVNPAPLPDARPLHADHH